HTVGGTPLLFETLQRSSSVTQGAKDLLTTFVPVLLVTLVVLAVLLVPLAWALAARLRRAASDRAPPLHETIAVPARAPRRPAAARRRSRSRTASVAGSPPASTTGPCKSSPVSRCTCPRRRPAGAKRDRRRRRRWATPPRRCARACGRCGRPSSGSIPPTWMR